MGTAGGCATLPVTDFDRAIGFYTEIVGLTLVARFGTQWACLDAGEGMLVGLISAADSHDSGMSVAFSIAEGFDTAVDELVRHGVEVDRQSESGGSVQLAYFHDPDGNSLCLQDFPANPTSSFHGPRPEGEPRPFFEHLGLRWNTLDQDRISVELELRDDLRGPAGTLQGGIIATLVDVAAASTAALTGTSFVATTEMTIHYLAPGRVGPVRAVGELLRSGPRSFTVEARVYDEGKDNRLMAVALAAFASLDPDRSARTETPVTTDTSASPT